jgi:hypothetical protein
MKRTSKPVAPRKAAPKKASPSRQSVAKPPKKEEPKHEAPSNPAESQEAAPVELVRDRYAMPKQDYELLALLKKRAKTAGRPVKKSELLRAGLHALRDSGTAELKRILDRLILVPGKKKR